MSDSSLACRGVQVSFALKQDCSSGKETYWIDHTVLLSRDATILQTCVQAKAKIASTSASRELRYEKMSTFSHADAWLGEKQEKDPKATSKALCKAIKADSAKIVLYEFSTRYIQAQPWTSVGVHRGISRALPSTAYHVFSRRACPPLSSRDTSLATLGFSATFSTR